jgi:uncharacterized cysteine cluster protein YcgN (CxxCxxCC family)
MLVRGVLKKGRCIADVESLTDDEKYAVRIEELGAEMTTMLKRLRKQLWLPHSLRYLLVTERHKSGLPHFHALIHESGEIAITHRQISYAWSLGFTNVKLLDGEARAAWYIVKSLAEADHARVRASLQYGRVDRPS